MLWVPTKADRLFLSGIDSLSDKWGLLWDDLMGIVILFRILLPINAEFCGYRPE